VAALEKPSPSKEIDKKEGRKDPQTNHPQHNPTRLVQHPVSEQSQRPREADDDYVINHEATTAVNEERGKN